MKAIKKKLAEVESEIERLQNNFQIADSWYMMEMSPEELHKLLCSTSKIFKGRRSNLHNRKLILNTIEKKCNDDLVRCWGKKQEIAKRIVLHPYTMPITDSTHLLDGSVFLFHVC